MENNERDRKLDQWLDEALSQYSAAEPRIGLEQRVMAHVRAEQEAHAGRRNWWRWMPAFAAIAAVLIVMVAVRPYWEDRHELKQSRVAGPINPTGESKDKLSAGSSERRSEEKKEVAAAPARTKAVAPRQEPKSLARATAGVKEIAPAKDTRRVSAEEATLYKAPANDVLASGKGVGAGGGVAGGVSGGVIGGIVSNAPIVAAAPAAAPPSQAVEVGSAPAMLQTQSAIATEKVSEWPKSSKKVAGLAAKMKAQQPKSEQYDGTINVMGVNVRFNSTVSAGQFPTPTPLSKQEKLALAVSQQPGVVTKSDEVKPLEIKKIEIAPLPGPEKEK